MGWAGLMLLLITSQHLHLVITTFIYWPLSLLNVQSVVIFVGYKRLLTWTSLKKYIFVKLRQGSGKEGQGMAVKAKGLKA